MKKQILSIASIAFAGLCFAQGPTITSAVIPSIGSTSTFRTFDASVFSPGSADTGTTWDFSNITADGTSISEYKDPSNIQGSGPFTGSNLGVEQGVDVKIFFKTSSTELSLVGSKFQTLTENYKNNPREALRFPIAHGVQFVDSFSGTAQLSTFTADRNGDITIEGDGFGTLILPYATFEKVLRVRTIATYEDEFLGNVVNEGTDTIYTWYKEGLEDYLFNWTHIDASMLGETFYGVYLDTMFVGINDVNNTASNRLRLYPNPANDYVNLDIDIYLSSSYLVDIISISGQNVKSVSVNQESGTQPRIYIGDLNKGLYYVRINNGLVVESKKLLVE